MEVLRKQRRISLHLIRSLREKILYPLGDVPGTVSGLLISIFLQSFLLEAVQLSAYWVRSPFICTLLLALARSCTLQTGTVLLLGHLMSVVANPLVGQLSDSTRTRYGRRRPWIAAWAIPFGVFYACMWLHPRVIETDLQKFGCAFLLPCRQHYLLKLLTALMRRWYAGFYILWTLSHSATSVPYAALTPEICYRYALRAL